jgi:hypothetical protein
MKLSVAHSFLVGIIILSCSRNNEKSCTIDQEFKRNFDNCVKIIETRVDPDSINVDISPRDIARAFSCLETLVGKQTKSLDAPADLKGYENMTDFEIDKKVWSAWYEMNKCNATMETAEREFAKYRTPLPNYKDPKVMEMIKERFPENLKDSARSLDSISHVNYSVDWPKILK